MASVVAFDPKAEVKASWVVKSSSYREDFTIVAPGGGAPEDGPTGLMAAVAAGMDKFIMDLKSGRLPADYYPEIMDYRGGVELTIDFTVSGPNGNEPGTGVFWIEADEGDLVEHGNS